MLKRAYSLLDIKSIDAEQRVITGIATSASTDSYGDSVKSDGAEYTLPIPLLWQHDSKSPIGEVFAARSTKDGIEISARIAKTDTPGKLKDRLDEAWQSIALKLVRGLSIGFRSLEESYDESTGGFNFIRWQWLELSAVTIPANQDANIQTIRSLDIGAASGAAKSSPGASGLSRVVSTRRTPQAMKKSYADLIADCVAARKEKTDRIDALLTKSGDAGLTLDGAEAEDHDTLAAEVAALDGQLARYRAAEKREKESLAVVGGRTADEGVHARAGATISVSAPKLPQGILFARYVMCTGMAQGNRNEAKQLAVDNYGDNAAPIIKMIDGASRGLGRGMREKSAVGAANAQTAGWASELVPYNIMDDFIEYLRPKTILGKFGTNQNGVQIPSLMKVPFNTRVSGFSAGLSANWVGEGLPILLSKATSMTLSLTWAKIAALTALTKEEIRFSNPNAEAKVRDDIAKAIIAKQDKDFIDPAKSATANVSPASILFNTTPLAPTAATAAAFRTDFATLLGTFATLLLDPSDIVIVMSTISALNLSLMVNSLGVPSFPGLTMAGGTLLGFPVITSEALVNLGSPAEDIIVAVKAGDIYLADDGVVTVDASDQASIEMVDASSQSGISGTGASQVSLWQTEMVGLRAVREITWKLRRTGAARYLGPCLYRA